MQWVGRHRQGCNFHAINTARKACFWGLQLLQQHMYPAGCCCPARQVATTAALNHTFFARGHSHESSNDEVAPTTQCYCCSCCPRVRCCSQSYVIPVRHTSSAPLSSWRLLPSQEPGPRNDMHGLFWTSNITMSAKGWEHYIRRALETPVHTVMMLLQPHLVH